MRVLTPLLGFLFLTTAALAAASATSDATPAAGDTHRYVIERTFPAGALDGVNADVKKKVNANNATLGVRWVRSYVTPDKTKTYCVYEGPSEEAIRKAATLNGLPANKVTEVPVEIDAGTQSEARSLSTLNHRFVVEREFMPGALDGLKDAKRKAHLNDSYARFGVRWVTAYASADSTKTYWVYEARDEAAVRSALAANGGAAGAIAEIPGMLLPK